MLAEETAARRRNRWQLQLTRTGLSWSASTAPRNQPTVTVVVRSIGPTQRFAARGIDLPAELLVQASGRRPRQLPGQRTRSNHGQAQPGTRRFAVPPVFGNDPLTNGIQVSNALLLAAVRARRPGRSCVRAPRPALSAICRIEPPCHAKRYARDAELPRERRCLSSSDCRQWDSRCRIPTPRCFHARSVISAVLGYGFPSDLHRFAHRLVDGGGACRA